MEDLPNGVAESLEFERRNWAQGSVLDDHFYEAPPETSESPLETILKIEKDTDTTKYFPLPPPNFPASSINQQLSMAQRSLYRRTSSGPILLDLSLMAIPL